MRVYLDWNRGIELISPIAGSTASVAASVREFLENHGDGIYTVVSPSSGSIGGRNRCRALRLDDAVPATASRARATYLDEVDLSVFGLPLTFLSTNIP